MTVGRTEKPTGKTPPKKPAPQKASSEPSAQSEARDAKDEAPPRPNDDSPAPIRRERVGRGSYEDAGDQKRKRRPTKTGRPGR